MLASFALCALPLAAHPQEAPPAEPPPEIAEAGIEEIVVTARKRAENLQDTPLAVSAISGEELANLGVVDTNDISALAPNAYFTQTSGGTANLALAIRGVGSAEPALIRDSGVGVYVDGVYFARTTGAVFDLLDLERVEVLRGPQGTLYGRNATGGAVNFVSRKPGEDFSIRQTIGTGSWDRLSSRTRLETGELLPGLRAALAYAHTERDGYVNNTLASDENDPGSLNSDAFRVTLDWDALENLSLTYAYDWSSSSGTAQAFQLFGATPTVLSSLALAGVTAPVVASDRLDDVALERPHDDDHEMNGHALTAELDLGFARVKSITAYRAWASTGRSDLDGNAFQNVSVRLTPASPPTGDAVLPEASLFGSDTSRRQRQVSQELQLLGDIGESIDYVAGAYWFEEKFREDNLQHVLFVTSPTSVPLFRQSPFEYEGKTEAWALFANAAWTLPIFDERLTLDGGVRYSEDDKKIDQTFSVARTGDAKWDHVDGQFTIRFAWTEDVSSYVRVASAYKSGGFNPRASATVTFSPFDEETLIAYEAGLKSQWFDRRLQLNFAAFYSDYENLQTDLFTAGSNGAGSYTVNAGKAKIPGFELEALAEPFDGLTLSLNYGWMDPKYEDLLLLDPGDPSTALDDEIVDMSDGAKFGYRPDQTLAAGVTYTTEPVGSLGLVFSAGLDVRYTDDVFWHQVTFAPSGAPINQFNDLIHADAYPLLNAHFTVAEIALGERATLEATVYGRNITDEEYVTAGIDFGVSGFAGANFGEPASWGVDLTVEF
jgi:iron complex outermembrane receptor protein